MGIVTGLVALAIIGVVVIFFYDAIIDWIEDRREDAELLKFQRMHDIPKGLCTLNITFFTEVRNSFLLPPPFIDLFYELGGATAHPEIAEFFWNCRDGTQLFTFDRLQQDLEGLFLIVFGDLEQSMDIKIKSIDGSGTFRTCPLYSTLCKKIVWKSDVEFPEPVLVKKTYIIRDIPMNNYDIEFHVEGAKVCVNIIVPFQGCLGKNVPMIYNVQN